MRSDYWNAKMNKTWLGLLPAVALAIIALMPSSADLLAADSQSPQSGTSSPQTLELFPAAIAFQYLGDQQQAMVLAKLADGSTLDVTAEAQLALEGDQQPVEILEGNRLRASQSGAARIRVSWRGLETSTSVATQAEATSRPLRFRNDVLPVLTRSGCNAGKCHGSASGKDGFRLSLYGYDPEGDYYRLTQEMSGRRINCANPDGCLLVNKALGEVPHTGGMCLELGSPEYQTLVSWIAAGAQADPKDVPLPISIDVYPRRSVMSQPGLEQRLIVLAQYDDGSTRDVSDLAVFISNNDAVASVHSSGQVTATGPGSGFVMARFDQFTAGTSIVVRSGKAFPELEFESANYIDQLAAERWRDLHVQPSPVCDDETFLRRIYLDTTGRLPTLEQRAAFLSDSAADKREQLIDQLVDSQDFLSLWSMQLAELLQIRNANGLSAKGLQLYDTWLRKQVLAGVPVDKILRQLIPASGSTFENPAAAYYQTETTPQLLAENIAQAFLGTRIQCAQCHNHPFDRWTMDDYYGFASFVSQVGYKQARDPREITIYNLGTGNLPHPVAGREVLPKFLGGGFPELESDEDRRVALADWLTSADNNAFSQNIGNLVWAHFFGLGIVNPVDDVRISNPASNPELLAALGERLVEYDFDVRRLARDICNSKTYQLSTQSTDWNAWDDRNFSHARIRRLRAEVLLDCINQVTQTSDELAGLPLGGRAIEIPNGPSNNYFLETFGRAQRNTPCSCEVSTSPTLSQALHLLNGENTSGKIASGQQIEELLAGGLAPNEVAAQLYAVCLSRRPTDSEARAIAEQLAASTDVANDLADLFWAILNSNEFIFNH
jgi:hypothetical protein